jgi:hypothetical protein
MTMQAIRGTTQWVLIAIAALALASCFYWRSDAHRLSIFRAHKADYETLLGMLQHDENLTFINSGLTVPEDPTTKGISPQRIADYRRYMSSIQCEALLYEPSIGSALFVSKTASGPNILYFPSSFENANRSGRPAHNPPAQAHKIEGDWYLSSESF